MRKDFCSEVQCCKIFVTELLKMVLLSIILHNKVHISRNCFVILLLQNIMLCVFLNLWLISRIKKNPKSFYLLQVSIQQQFKNYQHTPNILMLLLLLCVNVSAFPESHLALHYKLLQSTEAKVNVSKCIYSSEVFLSTFLIISCILHQACSSFQKPLFMKGRDL